MPWHWGYFWGISELYKSCWVQNIKSLIMNFQQHPPVAFHLEERGGAAQIKTCVVPSRPLRCCLSWSMAVGPWWGVCNHPITLFSPPHLPTIGDLSEQKQKTLAEYYNSLQQKWGQFTHHHKELSGDGSKNSVVCLTPVDYPSVLV